MMLWWNRIKQLESQLKRMTESKEFWKEQHKQTSVRMGEYIGKLMEANKTILELKGNPPKKEPPPKYKEDLRQPIFQKIFKKGRKALLLETHPDHGGTREAMEEVEAAFEVLKDIKPVVEEKSTISVEDFMRATQRSGLGGLGQQDARASQFSNPFGHRGW